MARHHRAQPIPQMPAPDTAERMRKALRLLGWSAHTGRPRFGPKAQLARWALGQDEFPDDRRVRDGI
jgi:hypothetical protein